MPRRTITDKEISLIKAMLARGMKNRDIQFFFNRPERPVNSGRITCIASGTYSDSAKILRADEEELRDFLASHSPSATVPLVIAPAEAETSSPLSEAVLRPMFVEGADGIWRLNTGETDEVECKTAFRIKQAASWLRAVAALANNRGGYIFFGVGDKDPAGAHQVLGLMTNDFVDIDPADIAQRIRATFDPTPRFQKATFDVGRKKIGVLHVEQHPSRPIIATKADGSGEIREGDIFFRYPGQSTRINYADLRAMLDARDAQARADILPMIQRLLALGPNRAMIADLAEGHLMDGKRTIEMDEDITKELNLIKEGEFDERAGAPALRLIGDVKAATPAVVKKGLVTKADMQRAFLADDLKADAMDYIRCAVEVPGNDWLPIRYFARAAKMALEDLILFIEKNPAATPSKKNLYKIRLSSPDKAYTTARGPSARILQRLLAGETIKPNNTAEAGLVAMAIQGIARPLHLDSSLLRELLIRCKEIIDQTPNAMAKSAMSKAIARLDELIC